MSAEDRDGAFWCEVRESFFVNSGIGGTSGPGLDRTLVVGQR